MMKKVNDFLKKEWVAGGVLNLVLFLLGAGPYSFIAIIIVISVIPTIYSYLIYRKLINNK